MRLVNVPIDILINTLYHKNNIIYHHNGIFDSSLIYDNTVSVIFIKTYIMNSI